MARAKRRPKKRTKNVEKGDSEDDHDVPDPETEEFFYDNVDTFHESRDKILLQSSVISPTEESDEDEQVEEVLGLNLDLEDEEEDYSGMDDDENHHGDNYDTEQDEIDESNDESNIEKGLPNQKAWGKHKKIYYDADDQKEKDIDSEEEEALDKEEEQEALALQQCIAVRLDEQDFDVEEFEFLESGSTDKQKVKQTESKQERILKDLSKLSKEEKLELLAKDSPELFDLVNDFKEKLREVIDRLRPLLEMARAGKITNPQGIEYLEIKHQLIMNYLANISFYLLLKAHQSSVKNHPVIERLVQYRELLQKLQPLDVQLYDEMDQFLNIHRTNIENLTTVTVKPKGSKEKKNSAKKKVKFSVSEDISETGKTALLSNAAGSKRKMTKGLDPLSYYEAVKEMKRRRKEEQVKAHLLLKKAETEEDEDEDVDGKRSITYQISKNKGLTPKRKKELRNPRIKHRKKFSKAKIKRKSQVLPVVKELSRYGGETTGIRTHLTRSIKIK